MKYSKLMKERINRVRVLFKELGYDIYDNDVQEGVYSGGFESEGRFTGGLFIDQESKFLEIAYSFSFSDSLTVFYQKNLEDMLKICYEYGCYVNLQNDKELCFSLFSKLYFAGLNFYSLKETLRDFRRCVEVLKEIIDINPREKGEEGVSW